MDVDLTTIEAFLSGHRLAVVGASDDPKSFGRTVYRAFREHGYDVTAVHPTAQVVDGDPCVDSLAAVPGPIDGVVVMVGAERAVEVVDQAIALGVGRVWLFKGLGSPGAVSHAAVDACRSHGVDVVAGACPLMFLEPVGWSHRVHRAARRHNGSLVTTTAP